MITSKKEVSKKGSTFYASGQFERNADGDFSK